MTGNCNTYLIETLEEGPGVEPVVYSGRKAPPGMWYFNPKKAGWGAFGETCVTLWYLLKTKKNIFFHIFDPFLGLFFNPP